MYRITASNPGGTEYVIYDPVGAGPLPVLAPRITEELNEAGSLEFGLVYGHPAFGHLQPKQTYFTVTLEGSEIFYGRLLNAEPSPLGGQIQYTVAGALSFLQDGEMAPDPKNDDGSYAYQTMTAEAFFRRCINAYNEEIDNDERRKFYIGTINAKDKGKEREYQISSYTAFSEVIRQNLIDRYGGFLRVRKRAAGGHYIDWREQYGAEDNAVLSIGQNILSITNRMNGEDLITAIRPVGKDGLVLSGTQTINIFSSSQMNKYGKIIRSVQLGAAETEEELREQANALIDAMQKSVPKTSDIGLVDLHFVDSTQHRVNLGDVFTHIAGLEGERMTVATRNRDCENPQNDSVTLKNPKELEGSYDINDYKSNRTTGGDTLSRQTARAGGGAGMAYKYIHETQDRLELATKHIAINAEELEIHADMFVETANEFIRLSHTMGTLESELGEIQGTGVIQNSEFITQLAGQFQYDPTNHRVSLINGTELRVTENGTQISVGKKIKDLTDFQAAFEGSALWTQRNNITGIVGEFDIVTNSQGVRTLRVKSGGGLQIYRDNVSYGVYDNGSLTAGIIVDKINNGTATIKASKIYLLGETIASTIDADYIKNKIANIGTLDGISASFSGNVSATGAIIGGGIYYTGNGGTQSLHEAIKNVQIVKSGNTYTLQYQKFNATGWQNAAVSFSQATTLSGGWGGGTFTVTASPQNKTRSTALFDVADSDITWNGNTASFTVYANIDGDEVKRSTGKTLRIDASDRYKAGVNSGWDSATTKVTRSGNSIYGPISGQAYGTTQKELKWVAKLNQAAYTASTYKAETVNYVASSYTKETVDYQASSCTQVAPTYTPSAHSYKSSSYTASTYTAASHSYTASKHTAASHSYTEGKLKIDNKGEWTKSVNVFLAGYTGYVRFTQASHSYTPCSYTASKHSYTAAKYTGSSYTKETHSYTPSTYKAGTVLYTASSCTHVASKYTPSSHSYTPSTYKASEFEEASISWL